MKKAVVAGAAILVSSFTASAADFQRMDTFVGYTYTRFESGNFVPAPFDAGVPAYNANGGSVQWAYNFNKWFSGVVDTGAVHNGGKGGVSLDTTVAVLLAGPRVSFRSGRFVPYVQTLFGSAWDWSSAAVPAIALPGEGVVTPIGASLRYTKTPSGFALTAGGGVDVKLSKHVNFRPVQAEYFLTRLQPFGDLSTFSRNNFRYSAGFNFTYGSAR
jgi:hypothetical protein